MASLNTYIQQKVHCLYMYVHVGITCIIHSVKTEYADSIESQLELKQEMLQALQNDLEVRHLITTHRANVRTSSVPCIYIHIHTCMHVYRVVKQTMRT